MTRPAIAVALALCLGCTSTTRYRVNDATGERVKDPRCVERERIRRDPGPELPDDPTERSTWRADHASGAARWREHCEQEESVAVGATVALVLGLMIPPLLVLSASAWVR